MNKTIAWFLAITTALLLVLPGLWIVTSLWGYGGMMGGYGMMRGNYGFMNPLGWVGMAFMWLIPAAILIVLVTGVAALINYLTRLSNPTLQANSPASSRVCQTCGKPAQIDWNTCPYCGEKLG